ncbi:holo-ACP synthase [Bacillus sp. REN10]|uniref:holo-ACP synthase n=1 Tax=Bacillus sp. REN10 TaxID=2782541 RepID=UPI00193C0DB1|nr:holo-ACP synthase [Bacillus sp. REN10]
MAIGLGIDLVEIDRIEVLLERTSGKVLEKVLHPQELELYDQLEQSKRKTEWFAGRLAVKEAIKKAIGSGIQNKLRLIDIIITNDSFGKPIATFSNHIKTIYEEYQIEISITHSEKSVAAIAIQYPAKTVHDHIS